MKKGDVMKQSLNNSTPVPAKNSLVNMPKEVGSGALGILAGSNTCPAQSDTILFSSSLPVLPHEKLNLNDTECVCQFVDDATSSLDKLGHVEGGDVLEDVEPHAIGSLLPDDENDLLAGIMEDFDLTRLPNSLEDLEDYDLFGSGGGMELESDPQESLSMGISKVSLSDGITGNGMPHYGLPNGASTVAGEHPLGEHPSRTLFVRNINSNVEDIELRQLFEQFGDIRTLYTACKHRGFVMISYYDIRAARTALRALQNKPLRRRKLDIHFSIPKDNPSDKDINQGTLVVFNLDPSVSNEDLRQIFGAYGEVKEIRETPHKRHHKFIEFYDVRSAESALKSLNRSDIAGKKIKLEPSRPGGARRNLMLQLNQELEQDESWSFRHPVGSPVTNSSLGNWAQYSSPIEHSPLQGPHGSFLGSSQNHHHVGSAPSGVPLERRFGFLPESPETTFMSPVAFGGMGLGRNGGSFMMNLGVRAPMNGVAIPRNISENGSSSYRMMSSPRLSPVFLGNAPYPGVAPTAIEGFTDRGRSRRVESNGNQADSRKQFQLDLDKIISGEDTRTTLMIKNIPNKYTSNMLLAAIDENHKGTYDFLYLPIDFKNKCNVGYAFINMLSPSHIIPFYEAFNGKKWEKFNSEKVASLAYARIQGKAALVTHFQNSSLMNEDKRCRPILFHSEGQEEGDQIFREHFPSSSLNIQFRQPDGLFSGDFPGSPAKDGTGERPENS
ncbi:RNA-binding protein, putative [Ricinus communis]|uniref:RNA-binding protein, putative n=1 Tax=Ricinus communis TaxID=3988 RepID=B9S181_RICCO|nr:RNA-binding protein, putative [Ricinus communis]